jgi:pimeloyl-ACP methyl ester carboxylesterase
MSEPAGEPRALPGSLAGVRVVEIGDVQDGDGQGDPRLHFELMTGLGHFPMSEDPDHFAGYLLPLLDRIADV